MKLGGWLVLATLVSRSLGVAVPLQRRAVQPDAASQQPAEADGISQCTCDCCTAELMRSGEGDGQLDRLQCGVEPNDNSPSCGAALCHKPAGDQVLSTAESEQVDLQRFCFFECEPIPQHGPEAPAHASAAAGDNCGPLSASDAALVKDAKGAGPMEVPKVMMHFLVQQKRHVQPAATSPVMTVVASGAPVAPGAPGAPVAPGAPGAPGAPAPAAVPAWDSVGESALAQSAMVVQWAQDAQKAADEAATAAHETVNAATGAGAALVSSYKAANDARVAAKSATQAERRVHAILEAMKGRAYDAAMSAVNDTMKEMAAFETERAKVEAAEAARLAQEDMEIKAPQAGEQAMIPYNTEMKSQADLSNEYLARGDELSTKAASLQLTAGSKQQEANNYIALGSTKQAQDSMMMAQQMLHDSVTLNRQANQFYKNAQSITDGLSYWSSAAQSAAYHAEVMVNPDAPPPSPPIVLAQGASVRKLFLRSRAAKL